MKKQITDKEILEMKVCHLEEQMEQMKKALLKLEIGLEMNGIEITFVESKG